MNQEEALLFLNVKSVEEEAISEAYQQICFEVKNYVLRTTVIRKLFEARIQRLNRVEEAFNVLVGQNKHTPAKEIKLEKSTIPLHLLRSYEEAMSNVKLLVANSNTTMLLGYYIEQMCNIQQVYEESLLEIFPMNWEPMPTYINQEVKASEQIASVELIKVFGKKADKPTLADFDEFEMSLLGTELFRISKTLKLA